MSSLSAIDLRNVIHSEAKDLQNMAHAYPSSQAPRDEGKRLKSMAVMLG
ncbi:hypothetical protein [Legionella maioricensis]|uniref:Uncharacterized protein n=1 Tax=Legionella maioricensis TaxID=2896528 RepID=A0A9X2D1S7_9GAMM|nr:hypothetical protein [Legionella maioricensis]MCL9684510.1 hypothetical protein [Legionella maioricensis]MCL9687896.1 hypothetical protein [Legionella maioricensis]